MLEKLHIENYRCLEKVDLEFTPLTVLVGPNGSGKSSLLNVLRSTFPLSPRDTWRWGGGNIRRSGCFRRQQFIHDSAGHGQFKNDWRSAHLHLAPQALRQTCQVTPAHSLNEDGGNLANVLATLPRKRMAELAARYCELIPLYQDVDVRPTQTSGHHGVVWQDRWSSVWLEPENVSDGSLVLLALLTLGYLEQQPDILTIEEPEHTLHPFLIGEVVRMLRQLAEGKLGPNPVQVVVATHSVQVLEFLNPEEVRFVSRSTEDGSTRVEPAPTHSESWQAAFEDYEHSLGEMWMSGSLGGVPALPPER